MARIAHLADLHIGHSAQTQRTASGQNQRQADFERAALAAAAHLAEVVKPDICVIAGDTLNDTNLYPQAMGGAVRFFRTLHDAGIPTVVIGGNHDEAESEGRYGGLAYLREHHGVDIRLGQDMLEIAGVRLQLISYRMISRAAAGRAAFTPFEFSTELPNVLVTHGYAPGEGVPEIPPQSDTEIPAEWLEDPRFDLVLLGHIHHHTRLRPDRPVFYAGSTERRNFGEAQERPGFWVHELAADGTLESHSVFIDELGLDLTPRPMIVEEVNTDGMTAQEVSDQVLELVRRPETSGALYKLVLLNVSGELNRSRAREAWQRAFRDAGGFFFDPEPQTKRITELLDVRFAEAPEDIGAAFQSFLKEQLYDSEDQRLRISKLGARFMDEARELVVASQSKGDG